MTTITTKHVGAGGNWKVIDEKPDDSVVKQLTLFSCVAAVGEMLLRGRGILMPQAEIIDIIGELANVGQLAVALNRADPSEDGKRWLGAFVKPENLTRIAADGRFGVVLREGRPVGHMVMVVSLTKELIQIADPWDGTIYKMARYDFLTVWDGEAIFRWS